MKQRRKNSLHGYLIGFQGGWHMINGEIKAGINTHLSGNLADDLISKAIYWKLPIVSGVFFEPFVYSRHATRNRESPNRFAGD